MPSVTAPDSVETSKTGAGHTYEYLVGANGFGSLETLRSTCRDIVVLLHSIARHAQAAGHLACLIQGRRAREDNNLRLIRVCRLAPGKPSSVYRSATTPRAGCPDAAVLPVGYRSSIGAIGAGTAAPPMYLASRRRALNSETSSGPLAVLQRDSVHQYPIARPYVGPNRLVVFPHLDRFTKVLGQKIPNALIRIVRSARVIGQQRL